MNSTMNTITNEPALKRKARIHARRHARISSSITLAALKSRRRRANIISDSFNLTLTQVTYPFPHPPVPTPTFFPPALSCPSSPSSSYSSPSSSPSSHTSSLPTSPEPWTCDGDDDDISYTLLHQASHHQQRCSDEPMEDLDLEDEYHYYTQEFNKIISLASLYSSMENEPPRPESVCTIPAPRSRPKSLTIVRPPPRTSLPVPADIDEDDEDVLMYYMDDSDLSSGSVYSTNSLSPQEGEGDAEDCSSNVSLVDFEFEMDPSVRLRLPLSLPCSPIDLEADIREGLEELRAKENNPPTESASWSFEEELRHDMGGHALKSKWSTSTLGSVKEKSTTSLASRVLPYFSPKKRRRVLYAVPQSPRASKVDVSPRPPGRDQRSAVEGARVQMRARIAVTATRALGFDESRFPSNCF
ncbi:hypothetical protein CPB85DRAFT_1300818 [Mucidula mucida]|nr:hypothetical protein CPB85DRAFT_1300818 [Mucidula mucida]